MKKKLSVLLTAVLLSIVCAILIGSLCFSAVSSCSAEDFKGLAIYIGKNSTVELKGDKSISGYNLINKNTNTAAYAVYVDAGGTFKLTGGSIVNNGANAHENNYEGVGAIYSSGGKVFITSGTISGNSIRNGLASAIRVEGGGSLSISGGTIEKNYGSGTDSAIYVSGGTFSLSGGTISDGLVNLVNSVNASITRGTISSGLMIHDGVTLVMQNGSIYEGVRISSSDFVMNGGLINNADGAGVIIEGGTFSLNAGTISNGGTGNIVSVNNNADISMLGGTASGTFYIYKGNATLANAFMSASANANNVYNLCDDGILTFKDVSTLPAMNIKITSKIREFLKFPNATSKPTISQASITGYNTSKYYVDVYQSGGVWVAGLKPYVTLTVSNLSNTSKEGTVMGTSSGIYTKKCKDGDVITFSHTANGKYAYAKLVHGTDWSSPTYDESISYTIDGSTETEDFRYCYTVSLTLYSVSNGIVSTSDGGLCTVYSGQTPTSSAGNSWAYLGPMQSTPCTAVPKEGFTFEGVYDNSSCTGTPVATTQSFTWTMGSAGNKILYAKFVSLIAELPTTWKTELASFSGAPAVTSITEIKTATTPPSGYTRLGKLSTAIPVYKKGNIIAFIAGTVKLPANSSSLFASMTALTTFDGTSMNTSNVTNMSSLFKSCSALSTIKFGIGWTNPKVTTVDNLFRDCTKLSTLTNFTYFKTPVVTNFSRMFYGCKYLTSINLSGLSWANATNISYVFANCSGLSSLGLTTLTTPNVTNMSYAFYYCSGLIALNLSSFNTAKVTTMEYMFGGMSKLASLTLGSNFSTASCTDMSYMFEYCSSLASLDVSSFNVSNVTTMSNMFKGASKLASITFGSGWTTYKCKNFFNMFSGCSELTSLDLSYFNTKVATDLSYMFYNDSKLKTLTLGANWGTEKCTDFAAMFQNCKALEELDLSTFTITSSARTINMLYLGSSNKIMRFLTPKSSCPKISTMEGLYLDNGTDNIYKTDGSYTEDIANGQNSYYSSRTYLRRAFFPSDWLDQLTTKYGSIGITKSWIESIYFTQTSDSNFTYRGNLLPNIEVWTTSGGSVNFVVTGECFAPEDCSGLFSSSYLQSIDFYYTENFNTTYTTNMYQMFYNTTGFATSGNSLDVSTFITKNVTSMEEMFREFKGSGINVNGFNTEKVTTVVGMFYNCSNVKELRLASFNLTGIKSSTKVIVMLSNCSSIEAIISPYCPYAIDLPFSMYYYNSKTKKYARATSIPAETRGREYLLNNPSMSAIFIPTYTVKIASLNESDGRLHAMIDDNKKRYFIKLKQHSENE